jgi:hypothetical protein
LILRVVTAAPPRRQEPSRHVGQLERAAAAGETETVFMYLNVLVPTYSRAVELVRV